jgi:hypothetical protein
MMLFSAFLQSNFVISPISQPKTHIPTNLKLPDDPFWAEDAQEANANNNYYKEPSDNTNYADRRDVIAHNAHCYHRFFQTVRQQDQTILGHLSYGVRGLMLDTYDFTLGWPAAIRGPKGAKVCLSHGQPGFIAFTQKGHNSYQSLQYELRRIIEFMRYNPRVVITIYLEDYANLAQTVKEIKATVQAAGYNPLFTPQDYPLASDINQQQWPTLGWMRANNKRLVIFTQNSPTTDVTWQQYNYSIENQYSTINKDDLWKQRDESKAKDNLPRKNVIFNNFQSIAVTLPTSTTRNQVEYAAVKSLIAYCKSKGFAHQRLFNGFAADRIVDSCNDLRENGKKTIFDYVNELNT